MFEIYPTRASLLVRGNLENSPFAQAKFAADYVRLALQTAFSTRRSKLHSFAQLLIIP